MFEQEILLNRFLVGYFDQVIEAIPSDRITERPAGNGHPPVWVLGHLAICAELGEQVFGSKLTHPRWLNTFGPGSSDEVADGDQYSRDEFVQLIRDGYSRLCDAAQNADTEAMQLPHGLSLLEGTPIVSVGDLVAHLLSTHFAFHLAQLSGWRRAAGFSALF